MKETDTLSKSSIGFAESYLKFTTTWAIYYSLDSDLRTLHAVGILTQMERQQGDACSE